MTLVVPAERSIRRLLRGPAATAPRWHAHRDMFRRAVLIVQVFYAVSAYRLYEESRALTHLSGSIEQYDLLWPVLWMQLVPLEAAG